MRDWPHADRGGGDPEGWPDLIQLRGLIYENCTLSLARLELGHLQCHTHNGYFANNLNAASP